MLLKNHSKLTQAWNEVVHCRSTSGYRFADRPEIKSGFLRRGWHPAGILGTLSQEGSDGSGRMTENRQDSAEILLRRGGVIESRHRVDFVVVRADGTVLAAAGDIERGVFPRSAIKPLQALPLVESGAAAAFGVSEAELALATASHGGEPRHVAGVRRWLARLGLGADDLECGPQLPSHQPSADVLLRAGEAPSRLHNNCSGKHAGFLTLARHLGVPTRGYVSPDHPVQRLIGETLRELTDLPDLPPPAIDGCGIPTFPLPLRLTALAIARFADPEGLGAARAAACRRIAKAMRAHSELVAGEGRPCTLVMQAVPEVLVKTGAEGVYVAAWPARRLALALKVLDGAGRASPVALMTLLDRLGALDDGARAALAEVARPVLANAAG
jgi:L-asparaginase II